MLIMNELETYSGSSGGNPVKVRVLSRAPCLFSRGYEIEAPPKKEAQQIFLISSFVLWAYLRFLTSALAGTKRRV